jgi:hypothetical protein
MRREKRALSYHFYSAYLYSKNFPPSQKTNGSCRFFPFFSSARSTMRLEKDKNCQKFAYFCLRQNILDRVSNAIFNDYKIVARIVYSTNYSRRIGMDPAFARRSGIFAGAKQ